MTSTNNNNNSQTTSTVLAWLQKELSLYSELLLISPIRETFSIKPLLVCLAHRFFPESIPNLVDQIQQPQQSTITLYQLFEQKLSISIPFDTDKEEEEEAEEEWAQDYLFKIYSVITDKRQQGQDSTTLRELHIGSSQNIDKINSASPPPPTQDFEKYTVNLLLPLNKLFHQLVELSIREEQSCSNTTRSPSPRIINNDTSVVLTEEPAQATSSVMLASAATTPTTELSPIKSRLYCTTSSLDDTVSIASTTSSLSLMTLEEIENSLNSLESREIVDYKTFVNSLDIKMKQHPDIAIKISAIDATHAALHLQLHKGDMLRTTIQFTNTAAYIRNELEFIQAKMLKTTTTDVGIQDLEQRAKLAGASIDTVAVRFKDLLATDTSQCEEYNFLQDKYRLICSWVDDVRVWFVEAERIRKWIEERIQTLESKPISNTMNSALEEVELDYELIPIQQLNKEQESLEREVEVFDKEDMTRLRAHVKALTTSNNSNKKDLSPADTTTIEITFTTLMTLDRLMHLLRRHNYELQMLTLRMYWEQEYYVSVTWVRATGEKVRLFVQHKARWRPSLSTSGDQAEQQQQQQQREEIIEQLIEFEKQSQTFDQGQFTTTVNMYQDLDDACNIELPSHLESRQVALEQAFEELTNRIAFARQVVEQYLVVTDFLDRAEKLKVEGEELRQEITLAAEQHNSNNVASTTPGNDFSEKVTLFQDNAVRLATGVAARIPYPEATHPTDQQGNDDANEVIRMVIGARKSALVLFGEALDHSLAAYRRALQLQKRGKQLVDEIARLASWVDERIRSIKKSKVEDVFAIGKCALDETDLLRLKKERDGQVAKLNGIKENDFKKLQENIQALQDTSLSQSPTNQNTVALISSLNDGMKGLQDQLAVLADALQVHSLCLDILEKRISWESQHYKSSQWISNMTFTVWEFVARKAQWRAAAVDVELTDSREVIKQEFDVMQNKVQEFYTEQLQPVDQTFNDLVNGFKIILENSNNLHDHSQNQEDITPEHVQRRQDTLNTSYHNLCDLIKFANQALIQHTALSNFSTQVSHLSDKGHGLISDIQAAMQGIMKLTQLDDRRQGFVTAVKEFSQDVVELWMNHGSQLPYPQCPEDARATRPSTSDDEISTEVATVIYKIYTELQDLAKRMADLLQRLNIAINYRTKLEQWCTEADEFTKDIVGLTSEVETVYMFDLSTGSVVVVGSDSTTPVSVNTYSEKADAFSKQVIQLKTSKYELLVNQLKELKKALEQDDQEACASVDLSVTKPSLTALDASWSSLTRAIELFSRQVIFCNHRIAWDSIWNGDWTQINQIQDGVREWINEKNVWLSSSNSQGYTLDSLVSRMKTFDSSIQSRDLGPVKFAFQDMVVSYKALVQITTDNVVDHVERLEDKQDDLVKLTAKMQGMVSTQLSEIELLKARFDWESSVDRELKHCSEKTLETESFIRDYARWSPSSASSQVDAQPIQASAKSQVESLSTLLNDLDHLQSRNSSLLQTELIFKKKSALESTIDRVQSHVAFVDQVLEQRQVIVSSLLKVSELETLAESIKTKLLSSDLDGGEQAQLNDYNTKVSELVQHLSQVMVYPVRHYRDHDATCREQDEAHNAVMTDMVAARKSRLDELGNTLESILKSKERLSRCKAAEETYMAEAKVVQEWIASRFEQVKELQPSSKSVDDLRIAVNAIGAIQSAAMTYTSSVQGLKESANQCIAMIKQQGEEDEGALGRIQSTQSSITSSWDELLSKIQSVNSCLSTDLRHAEYIQCVESFHTQCSTLQAKVVDMDLASVTEVVTGQWQNDIQMLESSYIEQIRSRLSEEKIKSADANESGVSQEVLKDMGDMLTNVLRDFDAFKKIIGDKTAKANHYRFKIEYFANADALDACMKETRDALHALKNDSSRRVIHGQSEEQDKATVKQVTETYQAICDVFENQHQEKYDEQRSFYRFLQLNKVSDLSAVDARQVELEKAWKQLKMDVANDKQHVDAVSQWYDLHSKLNEMQSEALSGIFQRLNQMVLEENSMPAFLEQDAALLKLLESRLSACWDIATSLVDDGSNMACYQSRHDDLQKDVAKAEALLAKKRAMAQKYVDLVSCQQMVQDVSISVVQVVDTVKQRLDALEISQDASSKRLEQSYRTSSAALGTTESQQKKVDAQATNVIEPMVSCLESKYADDDRVHTLKSNLAHSLEDLNITLAQEQAVNDMMRRVLGHTKSAENISTWIENCNTATNQILGDHLDEGEAALEIASLSQKLVDFENVIDSFKDLSKSLLSTEVSVDDHVVVSKLIDIANKNSTTIEAKWKETQEQLKSVEAIVEKTARGVAIARKIKNIMAMVGEAREFASSVKVFHSGNDDSISIHTQDDQLDDEEEGDIISDFDAKEKIDPVVINGIQDVDGNGEAATSPTAATVISDDGDDDRTKIGGSGEEMKSDQQVIDKEDDGSSEMYDGQVHLEQQQPLLSMLRQSEVENIQQNLQSLVADIKPQIESEVNELNTMISECDDIDSTFIRQHQEVQESAASLFALLNVKHEELDRALDIGKYLTIADDIEILHSSLEEALSKSAPHHAMIMGTGFSRTDLQAKLIELDARFKYYERKIVQNLTSAKQQAQVVIAKKDTESALVEAHLQEMEQKWELIKKQFKTRKIELSRTIDTSLDPKEQHARIRKSSLPTRKASSLLRDRADLSMSRLSPTLSNTTTSSSTGSSTTKSSSNTSRLNPASRSTNRLALPSLQHQPSKSATHIKPKTGRLLTPAKPPLNSYVADPDNDLDIEIGRIVNETPYRVKVKMVPGEVGRYWFGNLNPKLAYCRVLKSKMVMVRVGGGWTELSQFLRDHALLEGDFIPRHRRNTTNAKMMIPEEEEPRSPTIQEGFIETRRDFNRPQNQHRRRSVSPNTQQPLQHRSSTTTNSSSGSGSNRSNTTSSYPTGSPSHSASTTSGYKDGDKFIAVDQHGNQLEVQMRKAESNVGGGSGRNMSTSTANTSSSSNDYTRRRIARRKDKSTITSTANNNTSTTSHIPTIAATKASNNTTLSKQQPTTVVNST